MAQEHEKAGKKPRDSAADDPNKNVIIDLNTADEQTLANLPDIGPERAHILVKHRPYKDWAEVQKLPKIGGLIVDVLAMHGVELSHPKPPAS